MLDKQLTRQTSTSPFLSIREGASRKVSFDTRDKLGDKINKLTVMLGRLAAKDNSKKRPFKPQTYQGRGRGQNRGYSQRTYQNRNRSNNRSSSRDRRQFRDRPRFQQNYRGNNFQSNARRYGRQNSRGEYRNYSYRCDGYNRGRIDQEISCSQELEVQAVVGLGQDPEPVLIGIEYDAIIVESMTILQGTVPPPEKKGIQINYRQC